MLLRYERRAERLHARLVVAIGRARTARCVLIGHHVTRRLIEHYSRPGEMTRGYRCLHCKVDRPA